MGKTFWKNGFNTLEKDRKFIQIKSKMLLILFVLLLVFLIFENSVNAAYQSRPGFSALVNTNVYDFWTNMRELETSSGPMGLNATLDSSYNDTSSNGIDVHMMKNSEWGAVAMLALSGYGGGTQDKIGTYTTGSTNYTGVYGMGNGNWEYVMTLVTTDGSSINTSNTYAKQFSTLGIDSKYYDLYYEDGTMTYTSYDQFYEYNYSSAGGSNILNHFGDGIYETYPLFYSYRSSGTRQVVYKAYPFFARGNSGLGGVLASNGYYNGYANSNYTSRAVVVCGVGL